MILRQAAIYENYDKQDIVQVPLARCCMCSLSHSGHPPA